MPRSIDAGSETTITITDSDLAKLTTGTTYQVKVCTVAGNIYSAVVRAK